MDFLRQYWKFVLHGIWTGALILGVGGRIFMRCIALLNGSTTGFSWGGTMDVILLGAIIGLLSAPVIRWIGNRSDWPRFATAILNGLGLYLLIVALPIEGKDAAFAFPDFIPWIHTGFGILFLLFALSISYLHQE